MDCGRVTEKLNVEHRTSNIEGLMGNAEETEIAAPCSTMEVCFSFEVGRSMFNVRRSFGVPAPGMRV
jgi:hypothetical protein